MGTYAASVKKALSSQTDLIENGTHLSADPEKLATVNRAAGHQVRVKRNATQYALFTVGETRQESPDSIVRMGAAGRSRLGTSLEFTGTLDSQVPHPTLTDAEAEAQSEFVERLDESGLSPAGLVILAPHGGAIENNTDEQAEHVLAVLSGKPAAAWRCKGWRDGGGAFDRWHITSTEIHRVSFPLLGGIADRGFLHAVAFHGMSDPDVVVGGAAPEDLREEVRAAVEAALAGTGIDVRLAGPDDPLAGTSPANLVNWLTAGGGGVQLEQCYAARSEYWAEIAEAVADVFAARI